MSNTRKPPRLRQRSIGSNIVRVPIPIGLPSPKVGQTLQDPSGATCTVLRVNLFARTFDLALTKP